MRIQGKKNTYISITFLILFLLPEVILFSQPAISFSKTKHDFGIVASLNVPPAVFEFQNSGNEPLAIFLVKSDKTVHVKFQHNFIFPGETGRIYVTHNNNRLGQFFEEIEIISNTGNSEFLSIHGKNVSVQECFPDQRNFNIRNVYVIDAITKQPVPKANLDFTHNYNNSFTSKTNNNGKVTRELKIGQYFIQTQAGGYEMKFDTLFIRKSMPNIYLEVFPLQTNPEAEIEALVFKETIEDEIIVSKIDPEPTKEYESDLTVGEYAANNIILLLDISLSMRHNNKLELLKQSSNQLVNHLRHIDKVSIIAYSSNAYTLLTGVKGTEKDTLAQTIDMLKPFGITNGVKGLEKGYSIASQYFVDNGNNQVILATDGKFTGAGQTDDEIAKMIVENAEKGIIMSILGFGVNEEAIGRMKKMVKYGQGSYIHIDNDSEDIDVLLEEVKDKSRIK